MSTLLQLVYLLGSKWGDIVQVLARVKMFFANHRCYASRRDKYLVLENLITRDDCNYIISLFDHSEIADERNILLIENSAKKLVFSLKNNSIFYFNFPQEVIGNYRFLVDPLRHGRLKLLIQDLIPKMRAFMGTDISVEVVDIYKTEVSQTKHINSSCHVDGDHKSSAKLLIYLSDVLTDDGGPLQIFADKNKPKSCFGFAGTGILFYASRELHAGIDPLDSPRYCLNIKFYPTVKSSHMKNGSLYLNKLATLYRV